MFMTTVQSLFWFFCACITFKRNLMPDIKATAKAAGFWTKIHVRKVSFNKSVLLLFHFDHSIFHCIMLFRMCRMKSSSNPEEKWIAYSFIELNEYLNVMVVFMPRLMVSILRLRFIKRTSQSVTGQFFWITVCFSRRMTGLAFDSVSVLHLKKLREVFHYGRRCSAACVNVQRKMIFFKDTQWAAGPLFWTGEYGVILTVCCVFLKQHCGNTMVQVVKNITTAELRHYNHKLHPSNEGMYYRQKVWLTGNCWELWRRAGERVGSQICMWACVIFTHCGMFF